MRAYGQRKKPGSGAKVAGHQNCIICHPPLKNLKRRARSEGNKEIQQYRREADSEVVDTEGKAV